METNTVRKFDQKAIERKFASLVALMLDAENRKAQEEYDAAKRLVEEWQERFGLSQEQSYKSGKERVYGYRDYSAIPELKNSDRTPSWFKFMAVLIRNVFGVGTVLMLHQGGTLRLISSNDELLDEVVDFANTIQAQMYLYSKNDKNIKNKSSYYMGFIRGVENKLSINNPSVSLVLRNQSDDCHEWYRNSVNSLIFRSSKSYVKLNESYKKGVSDGENRGTRINGNSTKQILNPARLLS